VALAKMKVDREFTNVPNGMAGLSLSEKDILHDWKTVLLPNPNTNNDFAPPTHRQVERPCRPTANPLSV